MKTKFIKIYLFLLLVSYFCLSLHGTTWNPLEWNEKIRHSIPLLFMALIPSSFIILMIFQMFKEMFEDMF